MQEYAWFRIVGTPPRCLVEYLAIGLAFFVQVFCTSLNGKTYGSKYQLTEEIYRHTSSRIDKAISLIATLPGVSVSHEGTLRLSI